MDSQNIEVQLAELRSDVRHISGTMTELAKAVNRLADLNAKLLAAEGAIEDSKADRKELWDKVEEIEDELHKIHLRCTGCTTPDTWWSGQVTGWTGRFIWLLAGALVAWFFKWVEKR